MCYALCTMSYAKYTMCYIIHAMQSATFDMQYLICTMRNILCSMQLLICSIDYAVCNIKNVHMKLYMTYILNEECNMRIDIIPNYMESYVHPYYGPTIPAILNVVGSSLSQAAAIEELRGSMRLKTIPEAAEDPNMMVCNSPQVTIGTVFGT